MIRKIAFTIYPVTDMQRARKFYEEVLKLKLGSVFANGEWVEYDLPNEGCFAITTLSKDTLPSSVAGGTVAFEVDNLDDLMAALKAKHVEFKMEAVITPVCKMAVILDSEGNSLILHKLHDKFKL